MRRTGRRQQQTVVVDLGSDSIKMALAETACEAVRFHGITRIPLPSRADEEGSAVDTAQLVGVIRGEVQRRGWAGKRAACLLSGAATSTQSFMLPDMPRADLRRAIALKLKDRLHFDLQEAAFDYRRVQVPGVGQGEPALTLVAAAKIDSIRQGIQALRQAGLKPVAIGAAAESLANLSQCTNLWSSSEASINIVMRSDSAILNLFEGNLLRFSRELDTGGNAFTQALMRPILTANGAVQLTRRQAEAVKILAGYPREDEDVALPYGIRSSALLPLMEPVAQRLCVELERSMSYLAGLLNRSRIDRIVLSGAAGRMRNLERYLQDALRTPVGFSDPVEQAMSHWRLAVSGDHPAELAGFSAILGYSVGQRRPINLLPREAKLERLLESATRVRKAVMIPVAATGACLALLGVTVQRDYRHAAELLEWNSGLADVRQGDRSALEGRLAAAQAASGELSRACGLAPDWIGLAKDLAALLPAGAHITSLEVHSTGGQPQLDLSAAFPAGAGSLNAPGMQLTRALAESPFFRDVRVLETSLDPDGREGRLRASMAVIGPLSSPRAGER